MSLDLKIKISGESKGAVNAAKEALKSIEGIKTESVKAAQASKGLNDSIAGIKNSLAGLVGISAFAGLAKGILSTNIAMESLRAQLNSVSGSAESGARAFAFIQKFAADTPFEIEGLTKSFISLQNFGIEPTAKVMQSLTDQASLLGGSQETLNSIVLQLGQAYSKGKLQMEDMVVLMERGVDVYGLLEKVTGKNASELAEMAAKGELTRDVIRKLIEVMGELASGSNARAMDTLGGKISNLSDAWHTFEDTLLNDKSEGIIKSIVESTANLLNIFSRNMSGALDDQIAHSEARLKTLSDMNPVGKFLIEGGALGLGFDADEEKEKLNALKRQKGERDAAGEMADIKKNSAKAIAETTRWLDEIEGESTKKAVKNSVARVSAAESSAKSAERAYSSQREAIASTIADLQFELDAVKLSAEEKQKLTTIRSASAGATGAERDKIVQLVEAIDAETAAQKRQSEAWAQAVTDANELFDLKKRVAAFSVSNTMSTDSLNNIIADIQDTGAAQGLSGEELKKLYDQAGLAFNDGFIDSATDGLEKLNEFATQAARNIQNTFAEFLFDPFEAGTEGMLTTFRRILADMGSEMILSQVSKAAKGFDWGGLAQSVVGIFGGAAGSFGAAASAGSGIVSGGGNISSQIAAFFADGGIMSRSGPLPLRTYAMGGIANSPQLAVFGEGRMNEAYVPLPDGRSIPVNLRGGGSTTNNTININVSAPNGRIEPTSLSQLRSGLERSLTKASQRNS